MPVPGLMPCNRAGGELPSNRLEVILSKYSKTPHGGFRGPGDPVVSNRAPVNKAKSAAQFRKNVTHTKAANVHEAQTVRQGPMRGGIRL